ncbi:lateral signaling target protein 2 homolog [Episyrphus balteatus]|uniref:lateral signaling target protein 2 homolog n=1 Tax=Episyrphus balteatus TaxID=286459 RepID=UPI0024852569|nr:lateral signaling target protein 2 homolog [Episyrphus balteatus]
MTQRYQQSLQDPHMVSTSIMKIFMVFFTVVSVVNSGFVPPIQERGFMPINHRWQTSLEDSGLSDLNHFEPETQEHEFGDGLSDLHLHEDHGHQHYEHFEDSAEEHHPVFEPHSFPEEYEPKKEKTIHVHEHHHHYHRHYKTLPVTIIKKTVTYKHG